MRLQQLRGTPKSTSAPIRNSSRLSAKRPQESQIEPTAVKKTKTASGSRKAQTVVIDPDSDEDDGNGDQAESLADNTEDQPAEERLQDLEALSAKDSSVSNNN
jgi:hypothetical protein